MTTFKTPQRRHGRLTLALWLASTALVAPSVMAQDAPPADPAPQSDVVSETNPDQPTVVTVKRGRNVPNVMRRTAEVASFLTTEELKRTGDDNAAEALTRVTGLSIVEGKFIYVRGLGERYSAALLNGSPLPSPEPLQRVVPLDLFPSSVLSRVTVQKTYSPEYSGEFGGGVIDLRTLTAPREPFLAFGIGTGGNSETTFKEAFTHYGSSTDPFGFDDGTRDVPDRLAAAIATKKRISAANFPATYQTAVSGNIANPELNLQAIGQSLENARLNLIQSTDSVPANFSFNLSGGRKFDVGAGQFGVIAVVDFSNSWKTRNGTQGSAFIDLGNLVRFNDFDVSTTDNNVAWNGLVNLGYSIEGHDFQFLNFGVRRTTKRTQIKEGNDALFSSNTIRDDSTGWYERVMLVSQFNAEHTLSEKMRLGWRLNHAVTTRDTPYEKSIRYEKDIAGLYTHDGSRQQNKTGFSELEDIVDSAGIDFTYDFSLGEGRDGKVIVGMDTLKNTREATSREFRLKASGLSGPIIYTRVDYLLSDFNIRPGVFEIQEVTGGQGASAYEASLEVQSGFVKADVAVMPLVRVAGGLRFENAEMSVATINLFPSEGFTPTTTTLDNDYVLPAATVTWNFAENRQLRFGASQTIGRPQFRELAPQTYIDPEADRSYTGNPYLTDTEITNIDTRFEWYDKPGQYWTVGAFYKDITNPIEILTISDQGGQILQSFVNAPKATLYGLELDTKRTFGSLGQGAFFENKDWILQANYTYTQSEIKIETGDTVDVYSGNVRQSLAASNLLVDGTPMQGQSEHVLNLQFGFEDSQSRSQATLLATHVSERVSARGASGYPDYIQVPGTQLDFVYRKGFDVMGKEVNLSVEVRNLLGTEYEEYQEAKGRVDIMKYPLGSSLSLGLSTKF
jgi:TonB-dependent receptor